MPDPLPLRGQVAVISGAAGDIGAAIALELATLGADCALSDVVDCATAAQAVRALGRRCRVDRVDVADDRAVGAWIAACAAELGTPTLIVPNAAVVTKTAVLDIGADEWRRQLRIDLDGSFFVAQAGARALRAADRPGRIVAVGSWAADHPHDGLAAYCAAKAGLRQVMRCLALELAPHGICVNEVAPGWVDAGLTGDLFRANPGTREAAAARVPMRRLISPADVARQVAHLCLPSTDHVTGAVLTMDGGLSLMSGGK
ncbi:MAG TPA: SDR family oxidoreductase [Planctomycetota bacterium]|nr:SDR family oxidoreductase [Planctomycetota bacterium]